MPFLFSPFSVIRMCSVTWGSRKSVQYGASRQLATLTRDLSSFIDRIPRQQIQRRVRGDEGVEVVYPLV
jgi:hypothetical protein